MDKKYECRCGNIGDIGEEFLFEEYHSDSTEYSCIECGSIIEIEE
ncbi:MAG: hypothetical protein ACRDD7_08685 [Peptostreptococcaceae bacterium]